MFDNHNLGCGRKWWHNQNDINHHVFFFILSQTRLCEAKWNCYSSACCWHDTGTAFSRPSCTGTAQNVSSVYVTICIM